MKIDIGIKEGDRAEIAQGLSRLLADTYTLYLKTHNFHWNVTGPMFQTLHLMFETPLRRPPRPRRPLRLLPNPDQENRGGRRGRRGRHRVAL